MQLYTAPHTHTLEERKDQSLTKLQMMKVPTSGCVYAPKEQCVHFWDKEHFWEVMSGAHFIRPKYWFGVGYV